MPYVSGDAELAGLVDRWPDAEGGPSVVLTAWSVEHLGLRVSSDGMRWLHPGEREPIRKRVFAITDDQADGFDFAIASEVDPEALSALDRLVAVEDVDRRRRSAAAELLRPEPTCRRVGLTEFAAKLRTGDFPHLDREEVERRARRCPSMAHFEGSGPTWPIRPTPVGVCGGCGGKPLEFRTYCLVCDRCGADHLIRPGTLVHDPVRKPRKVGRGFAAKAREGTRAAWADEVGSARPGRAIRCPGRPLASRWRAVRIDPTGFGGLIRGGLSTGW